MWYLARGQKQYGPFSKDKILNGWQSGKIQQDDYIYSKEVGRWEQFSQSTHFSYLMPKLIEAPPIPQSVASEFSSIFDSVKSFISKGSRDNTCLFVTALLTSLHFYFALFMSAIVPILFAVLIVPLFCLLLLFIPIIGWILLILMGILVSMWAIPLMALLALPTIAGIRKLNEFCYYPLSCFNNYVEKGDDSGRRYIVYMAVAVFAVYCAFGSLFFLGAIARLIE